MPAGPIITPANGIRPRHKQGSIDHTTSAGTLFLSASGPLSMLERDDLSMVVSQLKLFQRSLGMCDGEGRERGRVRAMRGVLEASFILQHSPSPPTREDYRQIE
jgi:hypothetical protein